MATESVATPRPNSDDLFCKCQQVAGVIAAIAASEASQEELRNAMWGALALANEAEDMAGVLCEFAGDKGGANHGN